LLRMVPALMVPAADTMTVALAEARITVA
jgi:hypothetical protein